MKKIPSDLKQTNKQAAVESVLLSLMRINNTGIERHWESRRQICVSLQRTSPSLLATVRPDLTDLLRLALVKAPQRTARRVRALPVPGGLCNFPAMQFECVEPGWLILRPAGHCETKTVAATLHRTWWVSMVSCLTTQVHLQHDAFSKSTVLEHLDWLLIKLIGFRQCDCLHRISEEEFTVSGPTPALKEIELCVCKK